MDKSIAQRIVDRIDDSKDDPYAVKDLLIRRTIDFEWEIIA